jgi:hypothetical protein
LTKKRDPSAFIPALQQTCSSCGVAVVIVRSPNGCRASGVTRFLSNEKALLQLSFRYLSDDQFWFTFFHEAGHLLLHGVDGLFLEGLENESSRQEVEANEFAENILIPGEAKSALERLPLDARSIVRFAKKIGISPGIVVGQLQYHQRIRPSHFNGLKSRFRWVEG